MSPTRSTGQRARLRSGATCCACSGTPPSHPHTVPPSSRPPEAPNPNSPPRGRPGPPGRGGAAQTRPCSPAPPSHLLRGAAHSHLHVVALPGLAPQVIDHLHEGAPPLRLLRRPPRSGARRRGRASPQRQADARRGRAGAQGRGPEAQQQAGPGGGSHGRGPVPGSPLAGPQRPAPRPGGRAGAGRRRGAERGGGHGGSALPAPAPGRAAVAPPVGGSARIPARPLRPAARPATPRSTPRSGRAQAGPGVASPWQRAAAPPLFPELQPPAGTARATAPQPIESRVVTALTNGARRGAGRWGHRDPDVLVVQSRATRGRPWKRRRGAARPDESPLGPSEG